MELTQENATVVLLKHSVCLVVLGLNTDWEYIKIYVHISYIALPISFKLTTAFVFSQSQYNVLLYFVPIKRQASRPRQRHVRVALHHMVRSPP